MDDNRPVVGWKVPGRTAQGTVPFTETYCEYAANHLSAVCGGSAAFWLITLTRLEYSQYRGCADGQSRCPDNTIQQIRNNEVLCRFVPAQLFSCYKDVIAMAEKKPATVTMKKVKGTSIIYAAYSKDLSVKTTSAKVQMMKQGKYVGGYAPFGYRMHPTKRNALAIDPDSAQIVQRIFDAAVAGSNTSAIAQMLNDEDIPTPGQYFQSKYGDTKKFNYMSKKISWDVAMVLRVLKNQVYTGALVSHRRKSCGVGSRKTVPQEPIIVEGTHEAIISKETFLLAQRVIRRGNHEPRKVSNYPLRGLVCCGNCKRTMTRRKLKDGSVFYTCHHSNHDRDTECRVGEKYSESRLEDIVYNAIGDFLAFTEKQAVQNREVGDIRKTAIKDCAAKLKALQTQTDHLKNGKLRLYEKYTSGSISKAEYLKQKTAFDEKLAENAEAIRKAHERMQELDSECSCSDERVNQVCEQYRNQTALTFELTHAFIKAIYVHDADNIEILWKFRDIYEDTEGKK